MDNGRQKKYLFPALYLLAMALVVVYAWNRQSFDSGGSPLYRNLVGNQAYIRRGFDLDNIKNWPANYADLHELKREWYRFNRTPLTIKNSLLPDLPKRTFLSPFGMEKEEFTIIIPVEMDSRAISFLNGNPLVIPGINFAVIGENWEVYLNGTIIQSEMGKNNRTWRNVYFPFDKNLIVPGTNILALRISGDPAYDVTGLGYKAHHYLDDYRVIEKRQQNVPLMALCIIFGFTGFYYLVLFFTIQSKSEASNLYFGIFSVLLCMYTFTRHSIVNALIPNSDISVRIEYGSMMLMFPALFLFIEALIRGNTSRASRIFLYYCSLLALTQTVFSNQYGQDATILWSVSILFYSAYFLFYKLIFLFVRNRETLNTRIVIALVGMAGLFICGVYEIVQVLLFRNDVHIFHYSIFIIHLGMAFSFAQRFWAMDKRLLQVSHTLNELQKNKAVAENVTIGSLRFDLVSNRAFYSDKDILLSPKEFSLLYLLARNEGKTLSAKHLYETVWKLQYTEKDNSAFRSHIKNLKKKLADVTNDVTIETARSKGYYLEKV